MTSTWWVGDGELDDDQRKIITLELDESALVTGPPGSGKTNLLLLRANYLFLSGHTNIAVVTFTRSLCTFLEDGADNYQFPAEKIVTLREWQNGLIREFGGEPIATTPNFVADRSTFLLALQEVQQNKGFANIYDALLLDEAQDYTPAEIQFFSSLTQRLFCVADERQKIYGGKDGLAEIRKHVEKELSLRWHYRNGLKICQVADHLAKGLAKKTELAATSHYDEGKSPSTVDCIPCDTLDTQIALLLERLHVQLASYPGEMIGVLCPKSITVQRVSAALQATHGELVAVMSGQDRDDTMKGKIVIVSTIHSAKGLEYRALHMMACDELTKFSQNRQLVFTAVTRAKTALCLYHTGPIPGYLDAALRSLEAPPAKPPLPRVFGVKP